VILPFRLTATYGIWQCLFVTLRHLCCAVPCHGRCSEAGVMWQECVLCEGTASTPYTRFLSESSTPRHGLFHPLPLSCSQPEYLTVYLSPDTSSNKQ
ncbi:hypothetical protein JMJ77_0011769, partial [Colletotrichum scovillei]